MSKVHNCSECDFCYSNETMGELHLWVNGDSEYLGEFVDYLGLAEEDKDCVVIDGKSRNEIDEADDVEEFLKGNEDEQIF